jgi:hypothetical protein
MESEPGAASRFPILEFWLRLQPAIVRSEQCSADLVHSVLRALPDVNAIRARIAIESGFAVANGRAWNFQRLSLRPAADQIEEAHVQFAQASNLLRNALLPAFHVATVTREAAEASLGAPFRSLPLVVSNFVTTTPPEHWAAPIPFQTILDCQFEHPEPSLVSFRLASAPDNPARPGMRFFKTAVMALGLGLDSPVITAIREKMCGRRLGQVNGSDPTDQPTLDFAEVTDPIQRAEIATLNDITPNTGKFICASPLLASPFAACFLPLPPMLAWPLA